MKDFNLKEVEQKRPVITRDGRAAKVLTMDLLNEHPILATVTDNNHDVVCKYDKSGACKIILDSSYTVDKSWDLFMNTKTKKAFIAVFSEHSLPPQVSKMFESKSDLDDFLKPERFEKLSETIEIKYEIY